MTITGLELSHLFHKHPGNITVKTHGMPVFNDYRYDTQLSDDANEVLLAIEGEHDFVFNARLIDNIIEWDNGFEFKYDGKVHQFYWGEIVPLRGFELLNDDAVMPARKTKYALAHDLYSTEEVTVEPGKVVLVPTGITCYMPPSEGLDVLLRSGTTMEYQIILANHIGLIDPDYYGREIKLMIRNISDEPIVLPKGSRLCQARFTQALAVDDDEVTETLRTGGFHSTGSN